MKTRHARHAVLGWGAVLVGVMLIGGGCDGGSGRSGLRWSEARIQSPLLFGAQESVLAESSTSAFQVIPHLGMVLFRSFYDARSWEIVLSSYDGATRRVLASNDAAPGTFPRAIQYVEEVGVVLALLTSLDDGVVGRLVAFPVDGAKEWNIDADVVAADVSADGTRVNYLVHTSFYRFDVRTSLIASPQPTKLGECCDAYGGGVGGSGLSRSRSALSNVPFFYVFSFYGIHALAATAFGLRPAHAPTRLNWSRAVCSSAFSCGEVTANGRYLLMRTFWPGEERPSSVVDTETGTTTSAFNAVLSPDATRWACLHDGTVGVLSQTGESVTYAVAPSERLLWSADGKLLAALPDGFRAYPPHETCTSTIIDLEAKTTRAVTGLDCALSAGRALAFTRDDQAIVTGANLARTLSTVSLATGLPSTLSREPTVVNGEARVVDTGDGLVFADGWGMAYAHYDGTGWRRLDTPRHDEVPLDAGQQSRGAESAAGFFAWDETARRVVFQPVREAVGALSGYDPPRALDVAPLDGSGVVRLTTGTRTLGRIERFTAFDETDLLVFASSDLSRGTLSWPQMLEVGSLAGASAVRLSPTFADGAAYGRGATGNAWVFPAGATPEGVVYDDSRSPLGKGVVVQSLDASGRVEHAGYTLKGLSPNGTSAVVFDDQCRAALLTLVPGNPSPPRVLSPAFHAPSGCAYDRYDAPSQGAFTAGGRLVLYGSMDGGTDSTFLVDPATEPPAFLDLGVTRLRLFPDRETAVGSLPNGTIVRLLASPVGVTHSYVRGEVKALVPGGTAVLYSPYSQPEPHLLLLDLATGESRDITPFGVVDGGVLGALEASPDGHTVHYTYTNARWPYPCEDVVHHVLSGADGTEPLVLDRGACSSVRLAADGSALLYIEDDALFSFGPSGTVRLSREGERAVRYWVGPAGNLVVAQASVSDTEWRLFSVHADGSRRMDLAAPLPSHKELAQVQFARHGTAVLAACDALTDGVVELFRFDVP